MSLATLPLEWALREPPLPPTAVHAAGEFARALARRLLEQGETAGPLTGVATATELLLLGPQEALPWVEGLTYLGRSAAAPSLYLSTLWRPSLPEALVERALLQRLRLVPPVALLPHDGRVFPLAQARALDPAALRRWLDAGGGP